MFSLIINKKKLHTCSYSDGSTFIYIIENNLTSLHFGKHDHILSVLMNDDGSGNFNDNMNNYIFSFDINLLISVKSGHVTTFVLENIDYSVNKGVEYEEFEDDEKEFIKLRITKTIITNRVNRLKFNTLFEKDNVDEDSRGGGGRGGGSNSSSSSSNRDNKNQKKFKYSIKDVDDHYSKSLINLASIFCTKTSEGNGMIGCCKFVLLDDVDQLKKEEC